MSAKGLAYPIMRNSFCRSMCICIFSWFNESAMVILREFRQLLTQTLSTKGNYFNCFLFLKFSFKIFTFFSFPYYFLKQEKTQHFLGKTFN